MKALFYSCWRWCLAWWRGELGLAETKAKAEQGDAAAQCKLGHTYFLGYGVQQDYAEAVKWYRKSAEQGHADAQNYLGSMYEDGLFYMGREDLAEAVKW